MASTEKCEKRGRDEQYGQTKYKSQVGWVRIYDSISTLTLKPYFSVTSSLFDENFIIENQ